MAGRFSHACPVLHITQLDVHEPITISRCVLIISFVRRLSVSTFDDHIHETANYDEHYQQTT